MKMPVLDKYFSPNFSRRTAPVDLIVVHDTEGSYEGSKAWFAQTRSQVSIHFLMNEDGTRVTQMVDLSKKAWHACAANSRSIGIEGSGVVAKGFSPAWWNGMAALVAWNLHRFGLPCRWAQEGSGAGFCSHHDLGALGGGHLDPCAIGAPEWLNFIKLVESAYAEMTIDPDILNWGPAVTVGAPTSVPEVSHAGAQRHDNAPGSSQWVQMRLNSLGYANPPLVVDGDIGYITLLALERFQRARNLHVDGIVGPDTLKALA